MVELVRGAEGRFREIPIDDRSGRSAVVLLQLEGDLNFAVAQALSDRLLEIGRRRPRVIVLRVKRVAHLDATVIEALREATIRLAPHGTRLVLCGLSDGHVALLAGTELARALGEEGLVRSGTRLFEGFEEALRRARRLAGGGSDAALFRQESAVPDGAGGPG
jgi:anti-anti-sigma factor